MDLPNEIWIYISGIVIDSGLLTIIYPRLYNYKGYNCCNLCGKKEVNKFCPYCDNFVLLGMSIKQLNIILFKLEINSYSNVEYIRKKNDVVYINSAIKSQVLRIENYNKEIRNELAKIDILAYILKIGYKRDLRRFYAMRHLCNRIVELEIEESRYLLEEKKWIKKNNRLYASEAKKEAECARKWSSHLRTFLKI